MAELKEKFIQEIESGITHADYSLLSRRLMDLSEEFLVDQALKEDIKSVRKNYLNFENNLHDEQIKIEIHQSASEILTKIRTNDLTQRTSERRANEVLEAESVSKQFTQGKRPFYLHPISLSLKTGEITGVVGENGNGKTTLLRILAGELSSDSGEVFFSELAERSGDWYSAKNKIAFIPQRIPKWHGTLLDNLRFFGTIHNIKGKENDERIDYILFRLGLDKFRDLKWSEISSGYRLRFELAKMLLWKPKILILDEPLANLDINAQQLFLQDLRFFTLSEAHPISVILSSQNLHEIEKIADNIIFIRQGITVYNGPQSEFAQERNENSYELSGNFDLKQLTDCFKAFNDVVIENAGTSYIINTGKSMGIYDVLEILKEHKIQLNFIRNISQSTRKLFHKDI